MTAAPDDLAAWLLEQIAEDEAHARKDLWAAEQATSGEWTARYGVNMSASWLESDTGPVAKFDGLRHEADLLLAARFKPATVERRARERLAECDAKRRIIKEHFSGHGRCLTCAWEDQGTAQIHFDDSPCQTLTLLTLPYTDRPGYRAEWKP